MASSSKVSFSTNSSVQMKANDKAKLSLFLLVIIWAYAFKDNLTTLFYNYTDSSDGYHGLAAVFGISILYLSSAKALSRITIKSNQFGLLLLLLTTTLCTAANVWGKQNLEIISCLALLPIMFLTMFGWPAFKKVYYALAFICFALPIGTSIGTLTANTFFNSLVHALSMSSQEVYWQKNLIEFKNSNFDITQVINVLHHAMLFITLGFFCSYYISESFIKRILLGMLSILVPLAVLAMVQFCVIHFELSNQYTSSTSFTYFILASSMLSTFVISILKGSKRKPYNVYSESMNWGTQSYTRARWVKPTIVSCCILLTLPFIASHLKMHILNYHGNAVLKLPSEIATWSKVDEILNSATPSQTSAHYQNTTNQSNIELQTQFFATSLSSYKDDITGSHTNVWNLIKTNNLKREVLIHNIDVEEKIYSNAAGHKLEWSFYHIHQHIFGKRQYAIVADNWYTLIKRSRRSGLITVSTQFSGNLEAARSELNAFLNGFWPELANISNPPRKLN
jgi:hypothetical protein